MGVKDEGFYTFACLLESHFFRQRPRKRELDDESMLIIWFG